MPIRSRATRLAALLLAASALSAGRARADNRGIEASYFAAKLLFGIGGEVEIEGDAGALTDDLQPTWGAGLQYMARVHRHFAIGGLLAFQSWQSDAGSRQNRDRNLAIDGAIVPAGVLPLNRNAELYLAAGLAITMDRIGDPAVALNVSQAVNPERPVELDEAFGFALLPVVGARLAVAPGVGVLVELGYGLRWYEHDLLVWSDIPADAAIAVPIDVSLGQLTFALGVYF